MKSKLFNNYSARGTQACGSILMSLILSVLIVSGCGIRGSVDVVTEDRGASDFDRVSLTGAGKVIVTQGKKESLTVEAERNILPYIKTEVQGGTLILGFTDQANKPGFHINGPIKFYVNMEQVVGLDISGIGDIHVPSLDTNQLVIVVGMGGTVSIGSLAAEELSVRLAGRARVEVAGQVVEQNILLAGGAYHGAKLESQATTVEVKGLGNATVWATDTLDVQISGGGNVEYYGSPHTTQRVTGRGKLDSLGEP